MDEISSALEWLHFAEMDLSSAKFLLKHKPLPKEIICFHCQQATEKVLKGILVANKIRPPKIHDLKKLYALCQPYVQDIDRISSACNDLNQYSVQPRYPEELDINERDVDEALKQTKRVLEFLRPLLPVN
jgi:HEPN domain-containing protein